MSRELLEGCEPCIFKHVIQVLHYSIMTVHQAS